MVVDEVEDGVGLPGQRQCNQLRWRPHSLRRPTILRVNCTGVSISETRAKAGQCQMWRRRCEIGRKALKRAGTAPTVPRRCPARLACGFTNKARSDWCQGSPGEREDEPPVTGCVRTIGWTLATGSRRTWPALPAARENSALQSQQRRRGGNRTDHGRCGQPRGPRGSS